MSAAPRRAESTDTRHVPALDGVRGIAILVVLLFHSIEQEPVRALPDLIVRRVASFGWAGVDLFFVLSGFLITGILLDSKGKPGYFRNFYARRALRIFPLYYLFLIIAIFVVPALVRDPDLIDPRMGATAWWHWTYMVNVLIALRGSQAPPADTGHFWSLAVEEQFYLVWPALVYLFARGSFKKLAIATIVGAWLLRYVMAASGAGFFPGYVLMPARADALAAGALLAILAREPGGLQRFRSWALPLGAVALGVIGLAYVTRRGLFQLDGSFVALLASAVILSAATASESSVTGRFFRNSTLRFFGKYSYCLYVVHFPILHFIQRDVLPRSQFPRIGDSVLPGTLLFTVLVIGLSVLLSLASWRLVEQPMLRLKRFFPSGGALGLAGASQGMRSATDAGH